MPECFLTVLGPMKCRFSSKCSRLSIIFGEGISPTRLVNVCHENASRSVINRPLMETHCRYRFRVMHTQLVCLGNMCTVHACQICSPTGYLVGRYRFLEHSSSELHTKSYPRHVVGNWSVFFLAGFLFPRPWFIISLPGTSFREMNPTR